MHSLTKEKRLFERFSARFPLKLQHSRSDYGTEIFLRDASAQGFKIMSKTRMFLNDGVSLLVKLSDSAHPMTINGRVVWTKHVDPSTWEIGLEFHKIDFMKLQRLYKYIEE